MQKKYKHFLKLYIVLPNIKSIFVHFGKKRANPLRHIMKIYVPTRMSMLFNQ